MEALVNILVECPELIASVRVGVLEPLSYLESTGKCKVTFKRTIDITKKDIQWCDILVIVRGYEYVTLEIVKAAKNAGRFIIYFLDDDLLHIPEYLPSGEILQNEEVKQTLISIINNSNLLWCVNPRIGEIYSQYCNGKWILGKVPIKTDSIIEKIKNFNKVKILYAGSSDHSNTVQKYITPAVLKICNEYGSKVEFTFIGVNPKLPGLNNVKYIKYINDYNEYKDIVQNGNFDIGIAIILEEDFYQAKYYNKFIEYTSIGAVGIYTNNKPYTVIVEDKKNGFLCDNESWYKTIKEVIDDNKLRKICYDNANKLLEEKYSYRAVGEELEKSIPELVNYHADKTKKVILFNSRFGFYKQRIITIWEKHKVLFLLIIFIKVIKIIFRKIEVLLRNIGRNI